MNAPPPTRQSGEIAVSISISGSLQNLVRWATFHLRQRGSCASTKNRVGQISDRDLRLERGFSDWHLPVARKGTISGIRIGIAGRAPAALLLLLAGCAHQPLTRSCLTQKQYEQLKAAEPPHIHDKLTGDADKDTRPLAGSALELRSWGHAMLDTLKICSTP